MDLISDSMIIFEGISGLSGHATSPMPKADAMNRFLKSLDMSFRRDERSLRPRVNKLESRLDKEQKVQVIFITKIDSNVKEVIGKYTYFARESRTHLIF